jgi:hypothetical protein
MIARWARYLFLLASAEEMRAITWRQFLGPALIATWLAGMGRYWDHPSARVLQQLGAGSLIYVFALGCLLWLVIAPLRPERWSYLQIVTFVSLTSPPALLYAIPVERWMSVGDASRTNAWFLGIVAAWRVALLVFTLRRFAGLTWPRTVVGCLLPLAAIVTTLFALNLERVVFQIMSGVRRAPTPNDGTYLVLSLLTLLSSYAAIPLLVSYVVLVVIARWDPK